LSRLRAAGVCVGVFGERAPFEMPEVRRASEHCGPGSDGSMGAATAREIGMQCKRGQRVNEVPVM